MGFCSFSSKSVLFVLGTIFALAAFFLFGIAGYVIATYQSYSNFAESKLTLIPSVVAIGIGFVFLIAALLGCCGSDNKCTLSILVIFLVVLLTALIGGAIASQVYKNEFKQSIQNTTAPTFSKFVGNETAEKTTENDKQVIWVQQKLGCCGLDTYEDWNNVTLKWAWTKSYPTKVPASCCSTDKCGTGPAIVAKNGTNWQIYQVGCVKKITGFFDNNLQYVLGALVGLAVLLALGILASCILLCMRRQQDVPYFSLHQ